MSASSQLESPTNLSASNVWRFSLDDTYDYPTIEDRGYNLLAQIAGIYENGGRPDDSALLMDGTHIMMKKSISEVCRTTLLSPLPAAVPDNHAATSANVPELTSPAFVFQKCRNCCDNFIFNLRDGDVVTIISGIPKQDAGPYKTLSYVWGSLPLNPLSIPCLNCSLITLVPMISAQRFRNLMELGGAGNTIWLDALSIDQQDPSDIARCVAVMGHIYKNASCVSVLLPKSDKTAYDTFKTLELYAKVILARRFNFLDNSEYEFTNPDTGERTKVLTSVCQDFIRNIVNLAQNLDTFAYFRRAWTFQEWALANDLEVAVEGGDGQRAQGQDGEEHRNEGATCRNIKSLILGAAMLISRYKILQHQYVEINLGAGISRGKIPPLFNIVKSLFPDEDLFLSYEEVDPKKVSFQANFPHSGVDHLLGVRSLLPPTRRNTQTGISISTTYQDAEGSHLIPPRSDPQLHIRARLTLLLSVFASSKREAKYEADLVACWASMCNIKYSYDPHDSFLVALRKVKSALRREGISVYDFLPDTKTVEGPTRNDAEIFLMYAKEHSQLNATNEAEFPGAPIFTGRADTVSHMLHSLRRIKLPTEWNTLDDEGLRQAFTIVSGATADEVISLDGDLTAAMNTFAQKAVYGDMIPLQGFMFWSVQDVAKIYLEKVPLETRLKGRIVIIKIPFHKHSESSSDLPLSLHVWGILPADTAIEETKICREPVNGALTLVVERDGVQRIISFLVMSDHLSGTFLIHTNPGGQIDLCLTIPERGDTMSSHHKQIAVRKLIGEVKLVEM